MKQQIFNVDLIGNELKEDKEIKAFFNKYRKEFQYDTKFKLKIDLDVIVYAGLDIDSCELGGNYFLEDDLLNDALRKVSFLLRDRRKAHIKRAKQFKKDALKLLKKKVASVIEKHSMEKPTVKDMNHLFLDIFFDD